MTFLKKGKKTYKVNKVEIYNIYKIKYINI